MIILEKFITMLGSTLTSSLRDEPDAPLWVNLSTRNRYNVLTYEGVKAVLKRTAKRAGLKKRINPYSRMSRHKDL